MRGHIEELSDAEGGEFKVNASRILGTAPDPSITVAHRPEKNGTKIILKLSNGHSRNVSGQEPLPSKPRPRIIIKRPQRPVELEEKLKVPTPIEEKVRISKPLDQRLKISKPIEEKARISKPIEAKLKISKPIEKLKILKPVEEKLRIPKPISPIFSKPSSPLFSEAEEEPQESRKHGRKRHRKIYVEEVDDLELSSPSFVEDEDEEDEEQEEEEEVEPRKSKKHGKKRHRRIEMVDDSDDEDFDPMAEMRRKRSRDQKPRDSFIVNTPTMPNLVVERIDLLGDKAAFKNLQVDPRAAGLVSFESSGLGNRSEDNPIIKTLQKCHCIAASLKSELKATSTSEDAVNLDRYAEVDASAAKIVSQVWITRDYCSLISYPYFYITFDFRFESQFPVLSF